MLAADFVHLHVHTEFSLLDGMIRIKDLVERAATYQMPAVAITDHGAMFGAVHFYKEARAKGIKPIVGCEVYVAPHKRTDRDGVGHHLVLLCKNYKGYQNLCRLVSAAYLEGFYYKPRIDLELLASHHEGLIGLSACLKGEIAAALLEDNLEEAKAAAGRFKEIFTNNRFYLELQENGIADQMRVNRELLVLSKKLGLPVVATNDCHYLTREMAKAHEVLLCLQTGKTLADEKRMKMSTDEFYFRSPGEMKEKFAEVPEAIANTLEIAGRCNLEWDLKSKHFPRFEAPEGQTLEEFFAELVREGYERRRPGMQASDPRFAEREEEYRKRLEYEAGVIKKMGFVGYFLIVSDFVNWAKSQGIPVGPGRGSAAGSLISYALGITDLNPLAYGLIFERFLNPEREDPPDIDMDFCQERREEVIRYVTGKYGGSEYVAQIITFGTMKSRAVVRDVGRVLGVPYGEVDHLAKLIPKLAKNLAEAYAQEPRLREMREQDPKLAELLALAENLEGISRHASTHAAGVVISDKPLREYLPLYKDSRAEEVISQYDMKSVESVGLVKFDLLGLKTLTQIRHCVEMIRRNRGVELDAGALAMDDRKTYELLSRGDAGGVFQLESSGMKDLLIRLIPNRFEELIAIVALFRPGPLGSGDVDKFIERKHGRQPVVYLLPQLEEILQETHGVLLYQEQVMEIAVKLAGYSMGEADGLRKAMGKKIRELMAAQQDKFLSGAHKNGIREEQARKIFDDMAQFAGYGFNKSHAAVYAYIAYQTAFLKTHYPVEFMASLITMDVSDTDKVVRCLKECEEKKIVVDPPHVNFSGWEFQADGERIRFGLAAVKGVGKSAAEAIVEARGDGRFPSLYAFCERVDPKRINRRSLESLLKAGAFDDLGAGRSQLLAVLDQAMEKGHAALKDREGGQASLFDLLGEAEDAGARGESYPDIPPWPSTELLAFEKEALGFYLTGHPLTHFEEMMRRYGIMDTSRLPFAPNGQELMVGGVVTAKKEIISKKGKKERMAFITLTDLKGSVEVVVFANVYREAMSLLEKEDLPILVRGRVDVSEDRVKVLAGEILPLSQAAERLNLTLHLTLRRPLATPEQVGLLGQLLRSHQGKARVRVHVVFPEKSEAIVSLPLTLGVNPDETLVSELEALFGENAVRMETA